MDLDMVAEAVEAGSNISEVGEKTAGQTGSDDERLKVLAAHDAVSLLVTATVYVTLSPGYAFRFDGDKLTVGAVVTHGATTVTVAERSADQPLLLTVVPTE